MRSTTYPPLKRHRPNISSSSIEMLTDDILADILRRLSLKHITMCKSVSKLWLLLIPKLCIPRMTSAPMHSILYGITYFTPDNLCRRGLWSWARLPSSPYRHSIQISGVLPFIQLPSDFLDCYNGLLLFFNPSAMNYCVCNPSTRQMVTVPSLPKKNKKPPKTSALIFHPPHYKVVYISPSKPTTSINIFSPETGKWSVHKLGDLGITRRTPERHIFLGKSLYRLSGTGHLFKFDVIEEIGYQTIQLPEAAETTDINVGCIGASKGTLHFGWDDRRSKMMVWTLEAGKSDAYGWVLKHTISLAYFAKHPLCAKLHDSSLLNAIAFHPASDEIFVANPGIIFCYNPHTKRLDKISALSGHDWIYRGQDRAYPFSINLTPLDALVTP